MKHYILLLLASISLSTFAQPYLVGHASINFKDPARTGGYAINGGTTFPTGSTGRDIGTEIYYPATATGNNTPIYPAQFPLVVFGHGFAMTWEAYKTLTDSLVKNGYVVALPRTEGSLLPAPSHLDFGKDLAKVAALMLVADSTSGNFFSNTLNRRIAIGGHSMGGGATFLSDAFTSGNVKCYFTFAAAETNPSAVTAAASITKPNLVFSGTYDCVAPPATHQNLIYNALSSSCKTKIELTKGYHCAFADNNFNCGFGEGTCITSGGLTSANQQLLVRRYLNPYLDYYLKGICPAWQKFENLVDTTTIGTIAQTCNETAPQNPAILGDTIFCTGDSTILRAYPPGFTYAWNFGLSSGDSVIRKISTSVSLIVSNAVCSLFPVTVHTTAIPLPTTPTLSLSADTVCAGDTIYIGAGTANADYYQWMVPQGWQLIQGGSMDSVAVVTGNTSDTISVSAVNQCGNSNVTQTNIAVIDS